MAGMKTFAILPLLAILMTAASQDPAPPKPPDPNKKTVRGKVVDLEDKGVAGVKICTRWKSGESLSPNSPAETFGTDADGTFEGVVTMARRPVALMAIDADQKRGGVVVLDEKTIEAPITIKLAPLVAIRGQVQCTELGALPEGMDVGVSALPNYVSIVTANHAAGKVSLRLPPGDFQLHARVSGPLVDPYSQKLTVAADKPEIDLGVIDLKLTILGQHQGKEPPAWNITDARGADKGVKLADFKGKWVLIEFWGYW